MSRFKLCLVCLVIVAFPGVGHGDEISVYLLGGQSNMVGSGKVQELPDELKQPMERVFFWNGEAFETFYPGKTDLAGKATGLGQRLVWLGKSRIKELRAI